MKKTYILVLCAVVLIAVLLAWLNRRDQNSTHRPVGGQLTEAVEVGGSTKPNEEPAPAQPYPNSTAPDETNAVVGSKRENLLQQALEEKNRPLDFYGRVVDQDGRSLHGVQINMRLRHWNTVYLGSSIAVNLKTDDDGLFHATDAMGDVFDIESIIKEGYELEPNTRRGYSAKGGSETEPVLFKMWRSDIKEVLISGSKSFRVVPDGRAYYMNLHDGTINEAGEGDIKASIKYATEVIRGQAYDWSAQITVPHGGLLEETNTNSSMYVAPTTGYASEFRLDQQILGGQHGSIGTRRFFLKLKNGEQYGRMEIQMNAPYNSQVPGRIRIIYAINPSGARILR